MTIAALLKGAFAFLSLGGCAAKQPVDAAPAYYRYDFTQASELLREPATVNDDNVILDNVRLGLAAMANGDTVESEEAMARAFELLSTAGLNSDRTTAAVLFYEGVRIWKGEPFEQALSYYWIAANYATIGSWDNARAAAANSLFRLTDFGKDMTQEKLARRASRDESFLDEGYTAVDTNFALGFLMQAIASDLSGASGSSELFKVAKQIDPALGGIIATLESRRYDTLLLVDFGRGPRKIATGPDNAIAEFRSVERQLGPLTVSVDGRAVGSFPPACDVNAMAKDHRWNNLEDVRRAKSFLGTGLLFGGAATTAIGADQGSGTAVGIGVGLIALGALLKASAYADTRYLDFAPARIFVVPLLLERPASLTLRIGPAGMPLVLSDVVPGSLERPRAIYVRFFGTGSPPPPLPFVWTEPDATALPPAPFDSSFLTAPDAPRPL